MKKVKVTGVQTCALPICLTDEEDIFAPVLPSARRRAIWLGINLITALIASGVISLFQDTIEKVVALAVLMPIVASMGGIAGSQTLTLVIRGIALGNISSANSKSLLIKEILIGLLNSLLWASVIGVLSSYWFNNYANPINWPVYFKDIS